MEEQNPLRKMNQVWIIGAGAIGGACRWAWKLYAYFTWGTPLFAFSSPRPDSSFDLQLAGGVLVLCIILGGVAAFLFINLVLLVVENRLKIIAMALISGLSFEPTIVHFGKSFWAQGPKEKIKRILNVEISAGEFRELPGLREEADIIDNMDKYRLLVERPGKLRILVETQEGKDLAAVLYRYNADKGTPLKIVAFDDDSGENQNPLLEINNVEAADYLLTLNAISDRQNVDNVGSARIQVVRQVTDSKPDGPTPISSGEKPDHTTRRVQEKEPPGNPPEPVSNDSKKEATREPLDTAQPEASGKDGEGTVAGVLVQSNFQSIEQEYQERIRNKRIYLENERREYETKAAKLEKRRRSAERVHTECTSRRWRVLWDEDIKKADQRRIKLEKRNKELSQLNGRLRNKNALLEEERLEIEGRYVVKSSEYESEIKNWMKRVEDTYFFRLRNELFRGYEEYQHGIDMYIVGINKAADLCRKGDHASPIMRTFLSYTNRIFGQDD